MVENLSMVAHVYNPSTEEVRQMGISDTELPKKHLPNITKLARTVRDMCERDPGMGAHEEKL